MTPERIAELRRLKQYSTPGTWELWDGCSWRRFGIRETNETVICPTVDRNDGHPDLLGDYNDFRLVVALVNSADALLSAAEENERLRAENSAMRERLKQLGAVPITKSQEKRISASLVDKMSFSMRTMNQQGGE